MHCACCLLSQESPMVFVVLPFLEVIKINVNINLKLKFLIDKVLSVKMSEVQSIYEATKRYEYMRCIYHLQPLKRLEMIAH